jgi:hypothetical protein
LSDKLPKTSQATQAYERLFASQIEWRSFYPLLAALVANDMKDFFAFNPSGVLHRNMPTTFARGWIFFLIVSTFLGHTLTPSQ